MFNRILDPIRGRPPIVNVVRMNGIIMSGGRFNRGLSLQTLAGPLEAAFKPKNVTAVALSINSPGGSPVQSDLIGARVRDLAAEYEKPVIAFVEDVAASGGYWLACAADEIYVNPSSIVGSIGVISSGFGFQDAIEKLGVERRVHTAGTRKSLLDPFRDENPEDVAHLKSVQIEIHDAFKAWVESRRGSKLKPEKDNDLFEGKFWTGTTAVELGLADGLGDLRRILSDRYGKKTRFNVLGQRRSLAQKLGFASAPAGLPTIGADITAGLPDAIVSTLEERAVWSRYGL